MCNCCNKPYCFIFNFCIIFFPPLMEVYFGVIQWKLLRSVWAPETGLVVAISFYCFSTFFFNQHCLRSRFIKDWMNRCSVFSFFCVLNCIVIHKRIPSFHFKMKVHSEKKVKNKNLISTLIYSKMFYL